MKDIKDWTPRINSYGYNNISGQVDELSRSMDTVMSCSDEFSRGMALSLMRQQIETFRNNLCTFQFFIEEARLEK